MRPFRHRAAFTASHIEGHRLRHLPSLKRVGGPVIAPALAIGASVEIFAHGALLDCDGVRDRHDRRSPARAVLAGVEALAAQGVGDGDQAVAVIDGRAGWAHPACLIAASAERGRNISDASPIEPASVLDNWRLAFVRSGIDPLVHPRGQRVGNCRGRISRPPP